MQESIPIEVGRRSVSYKRGCLKARLRVGKYLSQGGLTSLLTLIVLRPSWLFEELNYVLECSRISRVSLLISIADQLQHCRKMVTLVDRCNFVADEEAVQHAFEGFEVAGVLFIILKLLAVEVLVV